VKITKREQPNELRLIETEENEEYVQWVAEGKTRTCSNDIRDAHEEFETSKERLEGSCNEQLSVGPNQKFGPG